MLKVIQQVNTVINVGPDSSWTLIIRSDHDYIANKLAKHYNVNDISVKNAIKTSYIDFCESLYDFLLETAIASHGDANLHIYDEKEISGWINKQIGNLPTLNLDPLRDNDAFRLPFSRGFSFNGNKYLGQVSAEGYRSYPKYLESLLESVKGKEIVLIEDDVFTGETLKELIRFLNSNQVIVKKVLVGFLVSPNNNILNTEIAPAIRYFCDSGFDLHSKLNLSDPGDFLFGGRGLVVKLGGSISRVPYLFPFIKPSDRVGFKKEFDLEFSQKIIRLNIDFYNEINEILNKRITISNLEEIHSGPILKLIDQDRDIVTALKYISDNATQIREQINALTQESN